MKDAPTYPDLVQINASRRVLQAVGHELLERTVVDYTASLDTAMTVFESNGDYATGDRPRGWCRFMDEVSRPGPDEDAGAAIASGRWSCRASCRAPALVAMDRGAPVDAWCPGGMRVHAAPIVANGEVVGSISAGCGGPPTDEAQLQALADQFGRPADLVRSEAAASLTPPASEALACRIVDSTALLLGEMIARRSAEAEHERARELYTGMVAHDLRSPLSVISMSVDGLLRSAGTTEAQTQRLQRIASGAKRMNRMVEDLLDLTRARVGAGIPLRLEPHPLADLAREIVEDQRLANPGHVLQLRAAGNTHLSCDADRLREVIENLIVNAIRHGQGSPVEVDVLGSPAEIVLRVHNGGSAIPAHAQASIFDPFDQGKLNLDRARSTGLGLGLHIAHEIVRAHGGTIDVSSSEEAGTVFRVHLPLSAP